jgi:hypothetical protein
MLAEIHKRERQLVTDMIANGPRYAHSAGFRQIFKPCRHVHAVAVDVIILDDDVPNIDSGSELDSTFLRHIGVSRHHPALDHCRAGLLIGAHHLA